jgi:hypothetical protein
VRRYSRAMPSGVRVPPTAPPLAFDVLDCKSVGAGPAPRRWRLHGPAADGRRLLLDFDADAAPAAGGSRIRAAGADAAVPPLLPPRLTRASVTLADHAWVIQAEQGRFVLGGVRLFVHEDVGAQAAVAVPPRPVPLGRRLFWRAVFALLATRAGRRWLERRVAA